MVGKISEICFAGDFGYMRFHDLRHTFATIALEHIIDVKTPSTIIGHVSSATTLDIYSHVTDLMQQRATVKTDRQIGKTDVPHTHGRRKSPRSAQHLPANPVQAP